MSAMNGANAAINFKSALFLVLRTFGLRTLPFLLPSNVQATIEGARGGQIVEMLQAKLVLTGGATRTQVRRNCELNRSLSPFF